MKKITKENLLFDDIKKVLDNSNRPLIIFQTTRVTRRKTSFQKGAGKIYEELKIHCQPVAVNSGYVWPKFGKKKIKQRNNNFDS